MKTITINNIEFTSIKAFYGNDIEAQDAILVHDLSDENRNGDCIFFGYDLPETMEDAEAMFEEHGESCFFIDENGIYHVEA